MLKPNLRDLPFAGQQDGVYWAERSWLTISDELGWIEPSQHLFLNVGTHGCEIAGPLALKRLLEDEWRWPNVRLMAVWQDPVGYDEEGYGFISSEGKASCWPPLFRYFMDDEMFWLYQDENSAWGMTVNIPIRHKVMRDLMDRCNPTFCLSLHETIRSEVRRDPVWAGAGLLTIETWPISSEELEAVLEPEGDLLEDPLRWLGRMLWYWIAPHSIGERYIQPKWKMAAQVLKNNPHYELTTKCSQAYIKMGGIVTGTKWMRYQEYLNQAVIGPGRLIHKPEYMVSDWRTVTDYAVGKFGCPGVTTETFPCAEIGLRGVDDRVDQQYKFIVSTLDILNERGK